MTVYSPRDNNHRKKGHPNPHQGRSSSRTTGHVVNSNGRKAKEKNGSPSKPMAEKPKRKIEKVVE